MCSTRARPPASGGAGEKKVFVLNHPPSPIREKRWGEAAGILPAALNVAPCDCGQGSPRSKIISVNHDLDFSNSFHQH